MQKKYHPEQIEKKWQKVWEKKKLYKTPVDATRENKMYILPQLPYPSGSGLHVGHAEVYTACDIYARFERMQGKKVLQVLGWDAFGLPAENYAIKTNIHPRVSTDKAIDTFRDQIKALGISVDWEREVGSHNPDYYQWTQWFFLLLYKRGLAYRKKQSVNWCDSCKTVLANEQVTTDGKCERCDTVVMQREMEQWYLKITEYADRLAKDLDKVDWPDETKRRQRNWIGRSEGAEIDFVLQNTSEKVRVFTTRPDTIFGVTYLVLAPEHDVIQTLKSQISNWEEVEKYIEETKLKTELDRQTQKEKTGVELKGIKAVNPANGEKIPVWMADYVFATYGTGAIMAVPAHDERDFEFAKRFKLPIRKVVIPPALGHIPLNRTPDQIAVGAPGTIRVETECWTEEGENINSDLLNGLPTLKAKEKIIAWLEEKGIGQRKVQFKLRDWSVSRQRFWGAPIPMLYDEKGELHPVPEEDLPVILPDDVDFKPTGQSPLTYSEKFHKGVEKKYGKGWRREPDTLDTFMCSSWYYYRYLDPKNDTAFASPESLKAWMPVDFYLGGEEHVNGHLLYSRFFTKVLFDAGYIDFDEPFLKHRHQGLILGEDSRKMSKRWGNVINPTDVVNEFGADTMRIYEMFMGPLEQTKPWNTDGVRGVRRFLDRIWHLQPSIVADSEAPKSEIAAVVHKTIKKVGEDLADLGFNTAIAKLMELTNAFMKEEKIAESHFELFLKLLSPFAPHIAEELWEKLGHKTSITTEKWPAYDSALLVESTMTIAIQVNGKLRDTIVVASDAAEEDIKAQALATEKIQKWLEGKEPKKVIYVKGKLVSVVV